MACALSDPCGAAKSARTGAPKGGTLVDVGLANHEVVCDELVVVLRVGHGRLEKLEHIDCRCSRRVLKDGTCVVDRLAADVIHHEAGLARGVPHVLALRSDDNGAVGSARRGRLLVDRLRLGRSGSLGRAAPPTLGLLFGGLISSLSLLGVSLMLSVVSLGLRRLRSLLLCGLWPLACGLVGLGLLARGAPRLRRLF